ncbi:MAG: hypothetical protein PWR07_655 [Bacillota bacterium]|nr:DUF2953 domain-containing protein [Bacillota bacterium]MDI6637371.1 DUF2953 domain-containing protein [Bacillota bacterium]MDK2930524.1 hypothetical protein [Bacillota bacterium]
MRWAVIVIACFLGVIALLFILVTLPLKVSARFVRTRGHSVIRVWVGVLSGLIWVPVYRKVPRPKEEREGERAGEGEDGTSVVAGWISRAQVLMRSLGDSGDGNAQQGDRGRASRASRSRRSGGGQGPGPRAARRRHDVRRRIGRFFYAALKATGLDVHRLRIHVELGSGEAATSAIGVGLAYALINTGLAACPVPLRFPAGRPEIRVTPRYDRAGLDASVDCIVALTPGYIILRGIQIKRRRRRVSCPTTR